MKQIIEFLSTKVVKPSIIKATNKNIRHIVKRELNRLGHDANLNHIDVSEVTNMYSLFSCADCDLGQKYADLNPDISKWDVSNVEDMRYIFYECNNFNCDISKWDVSKVKNMRAMFYGCKKFNQDISGWDGSNVEDYNFMFTECHIEEEFKPYFVN